MISKLFKASGITLNSDGNKDEMFIKHNWLFGDNQEIIEEVEQQAISDDQVEEIKHHLDDIEHT